jgi:hypothetical protein
MTRLVRAICIRTSARFSSSSSESEFKEIRPLDHAYFTGNSNYYNHLMAANALIRKHSLSFNAVPETNDMQWKSMASLMQDFNLRLNAQTYSDLKNRLNLLYPIQG